jgi:chemotaxis protein CheC
MNFTSDQIDALTELINIGIGRGASVLNTMLRSHIRLQVPFVKVLSTAELRRELQTLGKSQLATVVLPFRGNFSGTAELVFPTESASKLVTAVTGEAYEDLDFDSLRAGTLCEVGNIVLNGVMGSISNLLQTPFTYFVPSYTEADIDDLLAMRTSDAESAILLARTRFVIEELEVEGDIVLFLGVGSFDTLLTAIDAFTADMGKER